MMDQNRYVQLGELTKATKPLCPTILGDRSLSGRTFKDRTSPCRAELLALVSCLSPAEGQRIALDGLCESNPTWVFFVRCVPCGTRLKAVRNRSSAINLTGLIAAQAISRPHHNTHRWPTAVPVLAGRRPALLRCL